MHTSLAKLLPLPTFLLQIVQREKREWTSIIVAKYPNFDWHVQHHKIATWSTCILDRVDRNIESGRWGLVVLFYASGAVWWVTPAPKLPSGARLESGVRSTSPNYTACCHQKSEVLSVNQTRSKLMWLKPTVTSSWPETESHSRGLEISKSKVEEEEKCLPYFCLDGVCQSNWLATAYQGV